MSHMLKYICSVAVLTTLCGCGGLQWASYAPTLEDTEQDDGDIYRAAIRTLVRLGYGFASRDEGARAIETEYRDVTYNGWGSQYSYAWRIITAGGELSIFSSCKHADKASFNPRPQDCGDRRPTVVVQEEKKIRDMILADAKHVKGTQE